MRFFGRWRLLISSMVKNQETLNDIFGMANEKELDGGAE